MTITATGNRESYAGNGVTTTFAFPHPFFVNTDLIVYEQVVLTGVVTTLVLNTDYTVSGAATQIGGQVTRVTPTALGTNIVIVRAVPYTQGASFPNNTAFDGPTVEAAFDRSVVLNAQVLDAVSRTMQQPPTDVANIGPLPGKTTRANTYAGYDANGDPIASVAPTAGGAPTSSYGATLVGAAAAAAARAVLVIADATAKGSIPSSTGVGAFTEKLAGADGAVLFPSSGATDGLAWAKMGAAMFNGSITASVASSILTIALKTDAGADPSDASPVFVAFRNPTATNGGYSILKINAALSLTVPNTALLGTANGVLARLYVGIFNDAGTLRLSVWNPLSGTTLQAVQDNTIASSTLLDAAADNAQVIYTGTAVFAKAHRVIGALEISEATAGTWTTAPTKVSTLMPWDKRTGDVVQVQSSLTGAVATGTTVTPWDDTIPQNTEGDQYMSQAVSPVSAANLLAVDYIWNGTNSATVQLTAALFQDAVANALVANVSNNIAGAAQPVQIAGSFLTSSTAATTTFKLRTGGSAAGTTTFNGSAGARKLGGVHNSYLRVTEVQV